MATGTGFFLGLTQEAGPALFAFSVEIIPWVWAQSSFLVVLRTTDRVVLTSIILKLFVTATMH